MIMAEQPSDNPRGQARRQTKPASSPTRSGKGWNSAFSVPPSVCNHAVAAVDVLHHGNTLGGFSYGAWAWSASPHQRKLGSQKPPGKRLRPFNCNRAASVAGENTGCDTDSNSANPATVETFHGRPRRRMGQPLAQVRPGDKFLTRLAGRP